MTGVTPGGYLNRPAAQLQRRHTKRELQRQALKKGTASRESDVKGNLFPIDCHFLLA
jgi:hypothetical protein